MLRFSFLLCACLAAGCGSVSSALVPMALELPIPQSHGRGEAHVRATVLTDLERSTVPAASALYLPRLQLDGGVGVRFSRYFALRFAAGVLGGAVPAGSSTARPPRHFGWHVTVSPTFLIPLDHGRTQIGIGVDTTLAIVPYVWDDRWDCGTEENPATCGGLSDQIWPAGILGSSVSVSRALADFVRIGGSLGVRVQPTLDSAFGGASRAPTGLGYVAFALQAEVRFQIVDELALAIESHWVAPIGPYLLYPTVGATLYGTFGDGPGESPRHPETWIGAPRSAREEREG